MKHPFIRIRMLAAGALAAVSLVACGGGGSGAPATPPPPVPAATLGTLSVAITNKHACDFEAVNVTVTKFRVNKAPQFAEDTDPGWVDVPVAPARKINLMNLTNGVLEVLGQASLEVGHYRQLALVLATTDMANTVVPSAGHGEQALEVPGVLQKGILVSADFDVTAGQKTDIVFDFDACRSVVTSADGKHSLSPPAPLMTVPSARNGITGFVSPATPAGHVLVTAQQRGSIAASTKPDPETGEFWLSHLEAGNYDVVITADNSAASAIGTVPVAETATTAISTRASPIQLAPSSETGSISGTLTFPYFHSSGAVYMSARQQFASGQYYLTIRYKAADPGTDTFTLPNLPLAAPQYAPYTSTLPLVFTASSTATPGKYTVVASALAMLDSAVDGVDISTGNRTGVNVVLIPSGP